MKFEGRVTQDLEKEKNTRLKKALKIENES